MDFKYNPFTENFCLTESSRVDDAEARLTALENAEFVGLKDNAGTTVLPDVSDLIQLTDDGVVNADAAGNTIALSIDQGQIDHGGIGGLSDDDHSQYALLAGRAGGQTVYGGNAVSNNLTLHSTSNATKGSIYCGSNYFDETTDILHLVDDLIIGDGKDIGTTTTPGALTLSSTGSLFVNSTRIGTDMGSDNVIVGPDNFIHTNDLMYNIMTGESNGETTTSTAQYNLIAGYRVGRITTATIHHNIIAGNYIGSDALGSIYHNVIAADTVLDQLTGSLYQNLMVGSQILRKVTGDVYRTIAIGSNIGTKFTGNCRGSILMGNLVAYETTGDPNADVVVALGEWALRQSSANDLDYSVAIGFRAGYLNAYNNPCLIGYNATATANKQTVLSSSYYTGGLRLDNNTEVISQAVGTAALTVKGKSGQTADSLQVVDSSDNIVHSMALATATVPVVSFNKQLADIDFIVAGDTEANLLRVDANTDQIRHGDWDTNYFVTDKTGDSWWVGPTSGLSYGHMYAKNTSIVISVAAANTAYEVTSGITGGLTNNVTFGGAHYLSVDKAGVYQVIYNISATSGTATDEIEVGVMLNGSEVTTDGGAHSNIGVANHSENMAGSCYVDCAAADQLSLYVRNHSGAHDITVQHINLTVQMVGGT